MFVALLKLLGGISLFIYALSQISKSTESLVVGQASTGISRLVRKPLNGVLVGTLVAGITQSSVAVSFITVELVESGVISFVSAAPVIMGANIGTTVTAQLVSLSGGGGFIVGCFALIIGLLLGFCQKNWIKRLGNACLSLGILFVGLNVMDEGVTGLVEFGWFERLFMLESPVALFLNGIVLTAVVQSSSAITGITVILANKGLVKFSSIVYLVLGSNIGSCFSVIVASHKKSLEARRASLFNFSFNFLGAVLFFPVIFAFEEQFSRLFLLNGISVGRAIANFHTVFNLTCSLLFLPFYRRITDLICRLTVKSGKSSSKVFNKTFNNKSRRFN